MKSEELVVSILAFVESYAILNKNGNERKTLMLGSFNDKCIDLKIEFVVQILKCVLT